MKDPDTAKEPFDPLPNGMKRRLNAYQIDLKSLDREELLLWRDVFERDVPKLDAPESDEDGRRRKPGLLKLTDGALERRLTADLKAHVDRVRADIEAFRKSMPPQSAGRLRHRGREEADRPEGVRPRQPVRVRRRRAARVPVDAVNQGKPKLFTKGSGRLELAEQIITPADHRARHRQPHLALAHGPRHRRHAEQLRHGRRQADAIPSCSTTSRRSSSPTACRGRSCTRTS